MKDIHLTEVEREVMRLQGRKLGPDIDGQLVRQMTADELLSQISQLTEQAGETPKVKRGWMERQIGKLRREIERRSKGRVAS